MKKALITGITGQDGSYLAELLLSLGYRVIGVIRRTSTQSMERIKNILHRLEIKTADLADSESINTVIRETLPDEIYNLAAQSFVQSSFTCPEQTSDITGIGVTRILNAIRQYCPDAKFYQASSSEMFGEVLESPQREITPFNPQSPYGAAKCYAHYMTQIYRKAYGLQTYCGILFNHESPRRGDEFVTKKICRQAVEILRGKRQYIELGNLYGSRDWGFAGDYVRAMHRMLQFGPDDYVIATGQTYTVKYFVETVFKYLGFPIKWYGTGQHETGLINGKIAVKINPDFYRPAEVVTLCGDASKAKKVLGWEPEYDLDGLIQLMLEAESVK